MIRIAHYVTQLMTDKESIRLVVNNLKSYLKAESRLLIIDNEKQDTNYKTNSHNQFVIEKKINNGYKNKLEFLIFLNESNT